MTPRIAAIFLFLLFSTIAIAQVSFISAVTESTIHVNVATKPDGLIVKLMGESGKTLHIQIAKHDERWGYTLVNFDGLQANTNYSIQITDKERTVVSTLSATTQANGDKGNISYSFATGSCSYINDPSADRPGKPYGGGYEIFETIAGKAPEFMLWLGDNIYLRNNEWETAKGISYRYQKDRSTPELQTLLKACPQYAIWDDHDFGPNDEDSTYKNAHLTRAAFQANWGSQAYASEQGMGKFSYPGLDFFLLDDRSHRAPNDLQDSTKPYFGKRQLLWLLDELEKSDAGFKIVATGGQILNTDRVFENYSTYPVERRWLLNELSKREIKNVVFLTGDRHRSEFSKLKMESGFTVYDFTVSSLTSKTYPSEETNDLLVEGSEITEKNFAMITFTRKETETNLKVTFFSTEGKLLKEYELKKE